MNLSAQLFRIVSGSKVNLGLYYFYRFGFMTHACRWQICLYTTCLFFLFLMQSEKDIMKIHKLSETG